MDIINCISIMNIKRYQVSISKNWTFLCVSTNTQLQVMIDQKWLPASLTPPLRGYDGPGSFSPPGWGGQSPAGRWDCEKEPLGHPWALVSTAQPQCARRRGPERDRSCITFLINPAIILDIHYFSFWLLILLIFSPSKHSIRLLKRWQMIF